MKTVIQFPDRARTEREAAAWIARLDRGPLDADEQRALRVWLATDRAHREALNQMAQVWGNLDCMNILAELFPHGYEPAPERKPWWHWASAGALGVAAMMMLVVGLHLGGFLDGLRTGADTGAAYKMPSELVYRTERGEQTDIQLTDGSTLSLNTLSEARIHFESGQRTVYLTQGEAHFAVAHDPQRPFVVHAGQGQVRAVGTAFNVRLRDEQVEVLVSEGVVKVVADAVADLVESSDPPTVMLERGGSAIYTTSITHSEALPTGRIEQRLAWRKGKWLFEGETLDEVLDEVSRYTDRKIRIADPGLSGLRIGGYFDIGDVDGLMKALELGFGIEMVRRGDVLWLYSRQSGSNTGEG